MTTYTRINSLEAAFVEYLATDTSTGGVNSETASDDDPFNIRDTRSDWTTARIIYPFYTYDSDRDNESRVDTLPAVAIAPVPLSYEEFNAGMDNPFEEVNVLVRCFAEEYRHAAELFNRVELRVANRNTSALNTKNPPNREHPYNIFDILQTSGRWIFRDIDVEQPVCQAYFRIRGQRRA